MDIKIAHGNKDEVALEFSTMGLADNFWKGKENGNH